MRKNPGRNPYRVQRTVRWLVLSLLVILSTPLMAQQGTVQSELSASTITLDESVTLSVFAIGVEGELDTTALDEKFDVVGRASSRQISSIIGLNNQSSSSSVITWTLELMPREAGIFTVPAVSVGGVSSQLLSLTVNEIPAGARRDVFVEATVDQRTSWVQSQVLMTIRVYQGIEIVDGGLSDPAGNDIQVQRIGKDVYSNEVRDGRQYSVTERRFALFPQKSGLLKVDPVTLSVSVPAERSQSRGIFSATRKLTRRSDGVTLDVQARPSSGAAWWLPASAVTVQGSWTGEGEVDARVDQPLTRTIVMRGIGVLDSQLPDISIPAIEGVSLYAEEPVRAMSFDERGLVAEQTIKWALIPQREGKLVLPSVSVEWFDTVSGRMKTALLPEETITVKPAGQGAGTAVAGGVDPDSPSLVAPGNAGNAPSPLSPVDEATEVLDSTFTALTTDNTASAVGDESQQTDLTAAGDMLTGQIASLQSSIQTWRVIALMLLAVWLVSIAIYWWRRRRRGVQGDAVTAGAMQPGQRGLGVMRDLANASHRTLTPLATVESACNGNDAATVREALLDWASRQWPQQPPPTLTALASVLDDGPARRLIRALDASFYSRTQGTTVNADLMTRLQSLPKALTEPSVYKSGLETATEGNAMSTGTSRRGRGLPDL